MFEVTPETAFTFTKLSVTLFMSWPTNRKNNKMDILIFNIKWWTLWLNSLLLVVPLLYAAYKDRQDIILSTKSLCLAISCLQIAIKMAICKMMLSRLQLVLAEMEHYVWNSETAERELFLRYMKKCGPIHVGYITAGICVSISVILGPLILPQPFPTDAKYPFSVERNTLRGIIYLQQSITGFQVVSFAAFECQIAMMLWCLVVRFEYLGMEMKNIKNFREFSISIQKHQHLLCLSAEVTRISRYVLLTTVMMSTLSIILGGVHIVGNQPLIVKLQFTVIVLEFVGLLFMNAWPAEILIRSCQNIGFAIYESNWQHNDTSKGAIFVMQRSLIPIEISVAGFLPTLSLNYYSLFLSKAFSFFTTLRMVLAKNELD